MSKYFPQLYERPGGNLKVESYLPHYITKVELKGVPGINKVLLESKTGLVSLKTNLHDFDADKLKTFPANLSYCIFTIIRSHCC